LESTTSQTNEVAQRIASGTVWVNKHLELPPDIPFGGAKQSGFAECAGCPGLASRRLASWRLFDCPI
jgi:acyl-CoA reductase-like NAD-dependent aldehyde dehydrogenase